VAIELFLDARPEMRLVHLINGEKPDRHVYRLPRVIILPTYASGARN